MIYLLTNVPPTDTILNNAAGFFLKPFQYFAGVRFDPHKPLFFEQKTWIKTACMVALLIPALIIGIALRILSLSSKKVRAHFFSSTQKTPPPSRKLMQDPFVTPCSSMVRE